MSKPYLVQDAENSYLLVDFDGFSFGLNPVALVETGIGCE